MPDEASWWQSTRTSSPGVVVATPIRAYYPNINRPEYHQLLLLLLDQPNNQPEDLIHALLPSSCAFCPPAVDEQQQNGEHKGIGKQQQQQYQCAQCQRKQSLLLLNLALKPFIRSQQTQKRNDLFSYRNRPTNHKLLQQSVLDLRASLTSVFTFNSPPKDCWTRHVRTISYLKLLPVVTAISNTAAVAEIDKTTTTSIATSTTCLNNNSTTTTNIRTSTTSISTFTSSSATTTTTTADQLGICRRRYHNNRTTNLELLAPEFRIGTSIPEGELIDPISCGGQSQWIIDTVRSWSPSPRAELLDASRPSSGNNLEGKQVRGNVVIVVDLFPLQLSEEAEPQDEVVVEAAAKGEQNSDKVSESYCLVREVLLQTSEPLSDKEIDPYVKFGGRRPDGPCSRTKSISWITNRFSRYSNIAVSRWL